ncbi:hypothetical protein J8273_7045 [Carpediemonas membranifera]|uniref:Chromosome segregation in meiosis protein 3 domain-containing protein n=1 Tax=Carpediemonas membranifera TaxID=201153 RepID=A0A8J6B635_9EUKA|nr:hypothetical protein J8273_7045 [Carpediemonas membranifera]|eukprot:KAG9390792.1 hypothetical protein J8273_7045 [Carpediemonas membranifera]
MNFEEEEARFETEQLEAQPTEQTKPKRVNPRQINILDLVDRDKGLAGLYRSFKDFKIPESVEGHEISFINNFVDQYLAWGRHLYPAMDEGEFLLKLETRARKHDARSHIDLLKDSGPFLEAPVTDMPGADLENLDLAGQAFSDAGDFGVDERDVDIDIERDLGPQPEETVTMTARPDDVPDFDEMLDMEDL